MPDMFNPITDPEELARLRQTNNPDNLPTGHYTGRCSHCGSKDLWDDHLAYGCNSCGRLLNSQDIPADPATGLMEIRVVHATVIEDCEWCGESAPTGTFYVAHGYLEGPFKVGECCGERSTGLIKPEHRGPLLKSMR